MLEQRLLKVGVECYPGHCGEQTPRTLILGDRSIDIAEVVDAWLAPEYPYVNCGAQTAIRTSFVTMSEPTPGS
jgi:hypothetical protein